MNKAALAVILLSVVLGISPFALDHFLTKEQEFSFYTNATSFDSSGNQTKRIGLVTNSRLEFGEIPVKTSASRFLNISMPRKGIIRLETTGNISKALEHDELFYFRGRKEIRVKFNSTEPGKYEGEMNLKSQVPRGEFGSLWISTKHSFLQYLS